MILFTISNSLISLRSEIVSAGATFLPILSVLQHKIDLITLSYGFNECNGVGKKFQFRKIGGKQFGFLVCKLFITIIEITINTITHKIGTIVSLKNKIK